MLVFSYAIEGKVTKLIIRLIKLSGIMKRLKMIKLLAIIIAVFSFLTILAFFFTKRNEDNVVNMKDFPNPSKSFRTNVTVYCGWYRVDCCSFIFHIQIRNQCGGLIQKLLSFIPLISGFFPF